MRKLSLLAAALSLAAAHAVAETRYGLFVGINEYVYTSELSACDWDAACMYDAWTTSGGCPTDNASLFANRGATKQAVRERFASLAERAQAGDTVLYYQSSHGDDHLDEFGRDTQNACLCMTDDYYEDWEFADDLLKFADGVMVVVLIDACNSAGMFMSAGASPAAAAKAPGMDFASRVRSRMVGKLAKRKGAGNGPNIAFVTAADWNEASYETEHRQGEFTFAFLEGWAAGKADSDLDKCITFWELAEYAADRVYDSSVQYSNKALLQSIVAGGEYDRNEYRLICADGFLAGFYGHCPSSLQVPDGVSAIGWSAFDCDYSDAFDLGSVAFPSSLAKIGTWAFYGCENLTNITFASDSAPIECPIDAFEWAPVRALLSFVESDAPVDATGYVVRTWLVGGGGDDPDPEEERKIAVVDFDPTGSGATTTLELILGEPYAAALDGLAPQATRHGQLFGGWLINGKPLSPDMNVSEGDVIAASWRELAFNPLCPSETAAADATIANIYDGYVFDKSGASVGSVRVKVGKANARTHLAAVSATAQLLGGRKICGFKAKNGGKVDFGGASPAAAITLVKPGQTEMVVNIGKDGMTGVWGDYAIAGVRNISKASPAAYLPWIGAYGVAFRTERATGGGAAFAHGYSFVSVSIAAKGKVKVTGTMADGTKVNCSSQLLIAQDGNEACVNVIAPMYSGKAGGFGFVLWISKTGNVQVESFGAWKSTDANAPFSAQIVPLDAAKLTSPPSSLNFSIAPDSLPQTLGPTSLLADFLPTNVAVKLSGTKFIIAKPNKINANRLGIIQVVGATDNDAALRLSYAAKTNAFKGSFVVYALSGNKLKKLKAAVAGGFISNSGYGSAIIKGIGSIPLSLSSSGPRGRMGISR